MKFQWLKRSMPRGLFGRAALILLLPIVLLQVAISVVFIQRHFEDVTAQLTRGVVLELSLLRDLTESRGLAAAQDIAGPLMIGWVPAPDDLPEGDQRLFYDVSGLTVISTLRLRLPDVLGIRSVIQNALCRLENHWGVASYQFLKGFVVLIPDKTLQKLTVMLHC